MSNKLSKYFLVLCLGIFSSCQQGGQMEIPDYMDWVSGTDSGLKVAKELNDFRFELFYKPVEYIAINEQRTFGIDPVLFSTRVNELKGLQYYTLKIESLRGLEMLRTGINSEEEYGVRLQYFSDLAQYDMKLVDGTDTLSCVLFHFERNYGLAPYNNIVLGFPIANNSSKTKTLTFTERVLGVGRVNLMIEDKAIKNIPKIILN